MTNQTTDIHVVFGTGPAGASTACALTHMGKQVRVINRSGRSNDLLPAGVEIRAADATNPASAREAAEGAAVIYQCLNAPYDKWPELFPPLQAGVLQAATALDAKLVTLENVYMYGHVEGRMTEDLPYAAGTRKGRVRAQMSRELTAAHERGDVQVAIGRASDFYGPGVTDSIFGERTFGPLVKGEAAEVYGTPETPHTYSYIRDVGHGLALLGTHEQAFGEIWHLPAAPPMSTIEMLDIAFEKAGHEPKYSRVSRLMMWFAGLFNSSVREVLEMMYEFEHPFVLDTSKFIAAFGEHYTPIPEAIAATVEWYQKRTQ